MDRLTNRIRNHVEVVDVTKANNKLADLEDLMEKYGIENIERLEIVIDCNLEKMRDIFTSALLFSLKEDKSE